MLHKHLDVIIDIQTSTDLRAWLPAPGTLADSTSQGDGTAIETWTLPPDAPGSPRRFVRLLLRNRVE